MSEFDLNPICISRSSSNVRIQSTLSLQIRVIDLDNVVDQFVLNIQYPSSSMNHDNRHTLELQTIQPDRSIDSTSACPDNQNSNENQSMQSRPKLILILREKALSHDHNSDATRQESNEGTQLVNTAAEETELNLLGNDQSNLVDEANIESKQNLENENGSDTQSNHVEDHHPLDQNEQKIDHHTVGNQASILASLSIDYLNVLLVGESGVGKSTFINALINYLAFDSFEQARNGEAIAVIPVSFLLAVGQKFDDRLVTFGTPDSNENHQDRGESVTQQCRSYIFPIGQNKYLRLIDTPGIGDTRGVQHDDQNIDHICEYINTLPHLNAICMLLKPNESKLNIVMRCYCERLMTFLGEKAGRNICFCFTNTRSTFYGPGHTGSLIRSMIEQLSMKTMLYDHDHVFCFENEGFRFLMAVKNGIEFDESETAEYGKSWSRSVKESQRFLESLLKMNQCPQTEWRSIAHFESTLKHWMPSIFETLYDELRGLLTGESRTCRQKMGQVIEKLNSLIVEMSGHCVGLRLETKVVNYLEETIRKKENGIARSHGMKVNLLNILKELEERIVKSCDEQNAMDESSRLEEGYVCLEKMRSLDYIGPLIDSTRRHSFEKDRFPEKTIFFQR